MVNSIKSFSLLFCMMVFIARCSCRVRMRMMSTSVSASPRNLAASTSGAHRVTTFNVLSSHLAAPDYFRNCKREYLAQEYRLSKVKERLDVETAHGAVICLQEVSTLWAGELHTYFANRGYHLTTALYGKKFNGYMGVAIAVPTGKYEVEACDIQCIGDTKKVAREAKLTGFRRLLNRGANALRALKIMKQKQENPWQLAARRANQMICVKLKPKEGTSSGDVMETNSGGESFVVGTYHMPCMFRTPQVMMIHCALSAQHIHKFANGSPYVYCGDFNIKPDSTMYNMLTEGRIANPAIAENPAHIRVAGDVWECEPYVPLQSAYKEALGKEPDFTNYAQVLNEAPFIDTLDYIFLSSGGRQEKEAGAAMARRWRVESVLNIPHRDLVNGPLPAEEEPSDHIMLSANLAIVDAESAGSAATTVPREYEDLSTSAKR